MMNTRILLKKTTIEKRVLSINLNYKNEMGLKSNKII